MKIIGYAETQKDMEYGEKAHRMDLDNYEIAKIILKSQYEDVLREATLTYINTLSYNACWEIKI